MSKKIPQPRPEPRPQQRPEPVRIPLRENPEKREKRDAPRPDTGGGRPPAKK